MRGAMGMRPAWAAAILAAAFALLAPVAHAAEGKAGGGDKPWAAAEQIRTSLFDARSELLLGGGEAERSAAEARSALTGSFERDLARFNPAARTGSEAAELDPDGSEFHGSRIVLTPQVHEAEQVVLARFPFHHLQAERRAMVGRQNRRHVSLLDEKGALGFGRRAIRKKADGRQGQTAPLVEEPQRHEPIQGQRRQGFPGDVRCSGHADVPEERTPEAGDPPGTGHRG